MGDKILIGGIIALIILIAGCIGEKPNGDNVTPDVTQPTEPVIKSSAEAISLVKEKYSELSDVEVCRFLGDVCNHSIIVHEIPDGWNLTFWKKSKDCEDQCWVKHYFPFVVYENGTVIKDKDYKDIEILPPGPEIKIDLKENESFLIREGQTLKGEIDGNDVTVKYKQSEPKHLISVTSASLSESHKIQIEHNESCNSSICEYTFEGEMIIGWLVMDDWWKTLDLKIKPVAWELNNSNVLSSYGTWDARILQVEVHLGKKEVGRPVRPLYFQINVGETKNFEYGGNITVNYISSSPKQMFEVIQDREREMFEVDIGTNILSVDGAEKGDTCYKSRMGWWVCEYSWQKNDLAFSMGPVSDQKWNTNKLSFTVEYNPIQK